MAAVVSLGSMNQAHFMPTCLAAAMKAPEPLATSPQEMVPLRPTALFLSGCAFVVFGGLKRQGRGGAARTARFNFARSLADIGGAGAAAALISACSGSATKWAPWPLIQKARAFANLVSLSE